jgi:hypothetical protein
MDALKKLGKALAAYQFWLLSAIVFIGSAVVFAMTNMSLSSLITARVTKLDAAYAQITTIKGTVATHPNSFSHAELQRLAKISEQDVKIAWETQYNRQRPLLVWPAKAFSSRNDTIEIFKNLRPIEQYVEFPIVVTKESPIHKVTNTDRELYKRYIGPEFESVSKIIGTEWKAKIEKSAMGMGGYEGMAGGPAGMPGLSGGDGYGSSGEAGYAGGLGGGLGMPVNKDLVRWSKESQQQLMHQILPWYNLREPPTVLDIYYAQEDMWLLTGIMEIIRATNAGAVENFQTKVREIEWIRMGKFANRDAGTLTIGKQMAGGMGMGMGMGMDGGGMFSESGGSSGGMGDSGGMSGYGASGFSGESGEGGGDAAGGGTMMPVIDPADNRYISFAADKEFEPVKGTR